MDTLGRQVAALKQWHEGNKHIILSLFHVLLVSPLFIYVGVQRASPDMPEILFNGLIGLSIALFLYHFYRGYSNWRAGSSTLWINLIHIVLIAPLLLWIGYYGKNTSRIAFEMLLMLGFSALGYHLYSLFIMTNTVTGKP